MARIRDGDLLKLSADQDLELMIGPPISGSEFDSEEQRREAWLIHRERITDWTKNGRPWAAERYES